MLYIYFYFTFIFIFFYIYYIYIIYIFYIFFSCSFNLLEKINIYKIKLKNKYIELKLSKIIIKIIFENMII